jgi:hypothetical protein
MRWLLILLLAGCSHVRVDASSHGSAGIPGGAEASVHVHGRSLAALVIAGMFLASASEEMRDPRPLPSFSALSDWFWGEPKAELDPSRSVSEQDCSRPVALEGNLKCR